jgi:hypothetical protein
MLANLKAFLVDKKKKKKKKKKISRRKMIYAFT